MPSTRHASTGFRFPFAVTAGAGSIHVAFSTRRRVDAPMRISPGSADSSRRFAVLTASPVTSVLPSPVTTSPLLIPIRIRSSGRRSSASSALSSVSAACISTAARTARSASSSCSCGTPNTAMIASPMNFSIVPPWRSTGVCIAPYHRLRSARSDSGSRRSPSSVKPARSQKSTVTVFLVAVAANVMPVVSRSGPQEAKSSPSVHWAADVRRPR